VTWTISSEDPIRSQESFLQLPIAEELRKRDPRNFTEQQRRIDQGELLFTIIQGSQVDNGSNTKLFEVGQFLEFDNQEQIEDVETTNAPDLIDIMHFTNLLDLQAAGLTEEEIEQVLLQADDRQRELEDQVASLQVEINDLESQIIEVQKGINETNKAIGAIQEIGITDTTIIEKLQENLDQLTTERSDTISAVNDRKADLEEAYNSLLRVSELVR